MNARWILAIGLTIGGFAAGSTSAEPPRIDRGIGKEPAYQSKAPKYCLLVFGREGKERVWLARDGDALHVDRNGNGDLTDPGEKIAAESRPGREPSDEGYSFDVGEVTVGGRTHKGLRVVFVPLSRYSDISIGSRPEARAILARDPKALAVSLAVDVQIPEMKGGGIGGRLSFSAGPVDLDGVLQFANNSAEAPVVHLGGPLEITFYGERPTLRVGREEDMVLVVGTPGIGPGTFAMLAYDGTIPDDAKPVIDLSLPSEAGMPPTREKVTIPGRC